MRRIFRIKTLHLQIGALSITATPEGSSQEQDPILLHLWKGMRCRPGGKKSLYVVEDLSLCEICYCHPSSQLDASGI